jgi:DNA-binding MarR family transcriptional regulator
MGRALTLRDANSAAADDRRTKPPGDMWLDTFIPYLLYRATKRLGLRLHMRLRALRISPSQWRVLSVLKAYGALSIGEIVAATLMEQPTVSRVVARLERDQRVSRRLSSKDSRMAVISLTARGAEAFRQIVPAALRHQEQALRGIGRKEIAQLVATLEKIENNIEAQQ